MKNHKLNALILFFICVQTFAFQSIPKFQDGDKVCFVGNSITHGGSYHAVVQSYFATRYPEMEVSYFNCGISGDTADGMLRRFQKDIQVHKPNYAFLMVGMNDVRRVLYSKEKASEDNLKQRQEALDNYFVKTTKLVELFVENGIQPIFITPSIYDQTGTQKRFNNYGVNNALGICADHIRETAEKYHAPVVDFYTLMNRINESEQKKDSTFTIVGHDRVHPGAVGHFIMGYQVIQTLAPSEYVSTIELKACKMKPVASKNSSVYLMLSEKDKMTFKVQQNALPFPVKKELQKALKLVPFQEKLNKEILKVSRLSDGNYTLLIDDTSVGVFSNKDLEKGIDLSENKLTPQYKQAEDVVKLCYDYLKVQRDLRSIRFIEFTMLKDYKGSGAVEDKRAYLDKKLAELKQKKSPYYDWQAKSCKRYFEMLPKEISLKRKRDLIRDQIYKYNKPKRHLYKLVKT